MPRPGHAVDVALVEVMIDGRAQLLAAADAAAQQTSLEDVWTGRAPSQKVTRPCGLCGHFENISVPFLRRSCSHCSATWMPARCTSCATTVIAAVREHDAIFRGSCTCGGELRGLAAIPRQQIPRTAADVAAHVARAQVARRNRHVKVQLAGLGLAVVAGAGLVALLRAESAGGSASPPSATENAAPQPVDLTTSTGRGAAAGARIRAAGGVINVFACQAAYLDDLNTAAAAARAAAASSVLNPGISTGTNVNGSTVTITPRASSPVTGTNPGTTGLAPVAAPTPAAADQAYLTACLTG